MLISCRLTYGWYLYWAAPWVVNIWVANSIPVT